MFTPRCGAGQKHDSLEARDLGGEDEACVDSTELCLNHVEGFARIQRHRRAEGLDEVEPLRSDVDADHLVAEGGRELHGVVPEPAGRTDHGDGSTGNDVVVDQLLHRGSL